MENIPVPEIHTDGITTVPEKAESITITPAPEVKNYHHAMTLVESPESARKFLYALLGLIGIFVLSLIFVPWQQTVAGSGKVTSFVPNARPQPIESPISGRIARWTVNEGAFVRAGDTLAVLQDINTNFMDEEFLEKLQEFRDNSLRSQQSGVEIARQRTIQAIQRGEAADAAFANAKIEIATARTRYNRTKELNSEGLTSTRDLETAQLSLQKAQADSVRALMSLESARQDVAALKNDEDRIQNLARASVADVELRLANARQRQAASVIVAPLDGIVARIEKPGAGQVVKEAELLATIVPNTRDQAAEILVSSMDAAIIDTGRSVRLQFSGFPALQFSGFPEFSFGTFAGKVKVIDAVDDGTGQYRVLVEPDPAFEKWPDGRFLRQGAEATGWILLEDVSLGYELWRQINGFPPLIPVQKSFKKEENPETKKEKK
ncbi:MAG: HlyD family efflux transporter periplasmic adaptor subunit [Bacteroidota bacterium]